MSVHYIVIAGLAFSVAAFSPGLAQEARLNRVVVTGSYVDDEDRAATPNVTIRVAADFVLAELTYDSGTRDQSERKAEMRESYETVIAFANETPGISLEAGEIEYSAPVETTTFSELYRTGYNSPKSSFALVLRVDTQSGDDFEAVRNRADAFIQQAGTLGRTEAYLADEQYLGVANASKHRLTLLNAINAEINSLRSIFRVGAVEISGLEERVQTQPAGPLELEIFIPYKITITTRR